MAAINRICNMFASCPFVLSYTVGFKESARNILVSCYSSSPNMNGPKLLFPGQGSQYVGMTAKLQPLCPRAEEIFFIASSVLGYDLKHLCLNGPDEQLDNTVYCQPAVVVSSLVALEQLKQKDKPVMTNCRAMAGFSVGEITALIASNVIRLDQGLQLVKLRAELMQSACTQSPSGMMTVMGIDEETLAQICLQAEKVTFGTATIANYIFPRGFVVSATVPALDRIRVTVQGIAGTTVRVLNVSGGFHSDLMSSARVQLRYFLETVDFIRPSCPVYSNVTGLPYCTDNMFKMKDLLAEQIVKPVLWEQCIKHMIDTYGTENYIQIGPEKQLKAMMKRINRTAFRNTNCFET